MVTASDETGIKVMMELCQCVLEERRMPIDWKMSVVVSLFEGKGDVMNCGAYTRVSKSGRLWKGDGEENTRNGKSG